MTPTVPKAELLERERRWSRPAGFASLLGAVLFVAGATIQAPASSPGDTDAERLVSIHDHAGQLLAGSVAQGLGLVLFLGPLVFLFFAVDGRSDRVRRGFLWMMVAGPVFLLASGVSRSVGFTEAADPFVKELPALERQEPAEQAPSQGVSDSTSAKAEETQTLESEATDGDSTGTEAASDAGGGDEDPATPEEDRADELIDDSSGVRTAAFLSLPGILGLIGGMVYTSLWCMRTGLLTRFWGTLGIALAAVLVLLPFALLLMVIWFAAIGLILIGVWPRPLPPAWESGEAIPWLRPGQSPPQAPGDAVEGSGREVSERPLPEPPPPDAPPHPGSPYEGETQGQRRKRKRRR
jgi:hypothetical protein